MKKARCLKLALLFFLFCFSSFVVSADCVAPEPVIMNDVVFCEQDYYMPGGITATNNVVIDCNNARVSGKGDYYGFLIEGAVNVTLKNCIIENFRTGVFVVDSENITIDDNRISGNQNAVDVFNSKNTYVNHNDITDNLGIGIHFLSCLDCTHRYNSFENNNESMLIEHGCFTGDNLCPDFCNITVDLDCPPVCGDGICTVEGDCDCDPGEIPQDELARIRLAEEDEQEEEQEEDELEFDFDLVDSDGPEEDDVSAGSEDESLGLYDFSDIDNNLASEFVLYPIHKPVSNNIPSYIFEQHKIDKKDHEKIDSQIDITKYKNIDENIKSIFKK